MRILAASNLAARVLAAMGWWRVGLLSLAAFAIGGLIAHFASAPVDPVVAAEMQKAGRELFVRRWTVSDPHAHGDGLGPVFNATSCAACHFQGGVGGGGDAAHNVTAYEVHPTMRDRRLRSGLVHAFAVDKAYVESRVLLKNTFPIIKGGDRVVGNCTVKFEDFDPLRVESINSTALYGAGLIDGLAESTIRLSHAKRVVNQFSREFGGDFNTIGSGRPRTVSGGRLGKFGWKAQFATLEEFVAAACANELGLGNPLMDQAKPLGRDYCCDEADLTRQEFRQLVAFVGAIPRPVESSSQNARERESVSRGKQLFTSIGCAVCHTPDLGSVAGIYSDLMLHSVTTKEGDGYRHEIVVEVPLPDGHPAADEWRTPPLWGVADSAPYFHDGASPNLHDAILRHAGDAAVVTKSYKSLVSGDQQALIAFLKTLRAPPADTSSSPSLLAARN